MRVSVIAGSFASLVATASAAVQGFNYGVNKPGGGFLFEQDYVDQFNAAKNLVGASGFTSARLYTSIVSSPSSVRE
jgi:glucan endo-1,3-beta-D-glucosidase